MIPASSLPKSLCQGRTCAAHSPNKCMVVVAGGKEPRAKSKTGQRTTPSKPKDAGADASKIRKTSLGEGPEPHSSSSRGSAVGDGDEISGQQNVEAQVAHKLDTRGSVAGDQDSAPEGLPPATRPQVLSACIRVSAGMLAVSLPAREVARRASSQLFGTDQDVIDRLLEIPTHVDGLHVLGAFAAAALVTAARVALLEVWPEFAAATDRSNRQVLSPLGAADIAVVAALPGVAEELLFRSALIPLTFPDWRGALVAGALFGVLHNNGGRNWAFAGWAGAVGVLYGALFLYTEDIVSPVLAHSLANLASATLWVNTRK